MFRPIHRAFAALALAVVLAFSACAPATAQALTTAQLATVHTAMCADGTAATLIAAGDAAGVRDYANAPTSPAWYAWRSIVPAAEVLDAITWANLTPVDTADGTATFTNRVLAAQAKQMNLQILLQGRELISTGRTNVRQGLSDALLDVPTGAGGALLDAGWLGAGKVKTTITRVVTRAERVFATGTGTTGTPGVLGWEGLLSTTDGVRLVFQDNGTIWGC